MFILSGADSLDLKVNGIKSVGITVFLCELHGNRHI